MLKTASGPQVTAYQGMLLICAGLVSKGKTILRQDTLVSKLYELKDHPETAVLFEDIAFKKSLDTITSADIEDSLGKLQIYGAVGKLNPAYEKIVLYISPDEAEKFIRESSPDCAKAARIIGEAL